VNFSEKSAGSVFTPEVKWQWRKEEHSTLRSSPVRLYGITVLKTALETSDFGLTVKSSAQS
jgi:hypothetical protein